MLAGAGIRPNRRLGQNFLIDGNLMRKLVGSADIGPADVVLEVGPGTGSLTEMLLERAAHVVAVEVDGALYRLLASRLAGTANLTLLNRDALADKNHLAPELVDAMQAAGTPRDTRSARGARVMLVANLPYQVASPLIVELLRSGLGITRLCFTVQKEVAERIASPPGCKAYGPLSVAVQATCDTTRITDLGASVFWPRPQVASTMLRLDYNPSKAARIADMAHFARVVRTCFLHRRKKLSHALAYLLGMKKLDPAEHPQLAAFDLSRRPEQLSVDEWIALAEVAEIPPESRSPHHVSEL